MGCKVTAEYLNKVLCKRSNKKVKVRKNYRRVRRGLLVEFFVNPLTVQTGGSRRTQREGHDGHNEESIFDPDSIKFDEENCLRFFRLDD